VNITDAEGTLIGYGNGGVNWAATLSIPSKLADVMKVTPQTGVSSQRMKRVAYPLPTARTKNDSPGHLIWKKFVPPSHPRPLYENGSIDFAIGAQSWDTTSSACSVGGWDNGNADNFFGTLIFGNTFPPVSRTICRHLIV
jgi:hypothetical protein